METPKHMLRDRDTGEEKYRGPSAHVVAAGTGVFQHFKWAFTGLAGGSLLALIAPKQAQKAIRGFRNVAERWTEGPEKAATGMSAIMPRIKEWFGNSIFFVWGEGSERIKNIVETPLNKRHLHKAEVRIANERHGFGHSFISHLGGAIPWVGPKITRWLVTLEKDYAANAYKINAITIGGAFGAFGYISGAATGLFHGAQRSNEGKSQFQRVQQELRDTRALNDALERKLLDVKQEAIDLKTTRDAEDGSLRVAPDETPAMHDPSNPPATTQALLDSGTNVIESPPIRNPVIGPQNHDRLARDAITDSGTNVIESPPIRNPVIAPQNHDRQERNSMADSGTGTVDAPVIAPQNHSMPTQQNTPGNTHGAREPIRAPESRDQAMKGERGYAAAMQEEKRAARTAELA